MRARKSARTTYPSLLRYRLQRGRACEGAEISKPTLTSAAVTELQRGRACEGAEMAPGAEWLFLQTELQRGRTREGTEIGGLPHVDGVVRGASTGPRL